jgi:hypothetical protein
MEVDKHSTVGNIAIDRISISQIYLETLFICSCCRRHLIRLWLRSLEHA